MESLRWDHHATPRTNGRRGRRHSLGQRRRSCLHRAPRPVNASAHPARLSASGWSPKARQHARDRARPTNGTPAPAPDRGGGTRAWAEGSPVCKEHDPPEAATPSSRATKSGGGKAGGTGGGRGDNSGTGGRQPDSSGTGLRCCGDTRPHARGQNVNSRSERRGDDAFWDDSVTFMASSARVKFSTKLVAAVVAKVSALLTSARRTSLHPPKLLPVRQAWSRIDNSSWQCQLRAAPTLDLVAALRLAHDEA